MTREEAIEIFDRYAHHSPSEVIKYPREVAIEAFEMAIEALKAEPCGDCVSREAVIVGIRSYWHDEYYQRVPITEEREDLINDVINHLPSVTPERPKGRIIMGGYDCEHYCCSECKHDFGWYSKPTYNYCPNCGAKMEGENE